MQIVFIYKYKYELKCCKELLKDYYSEAIKPPHFTIDIDRYEIFPLIQSKKQYHKQYNTIQYNILK